MTAFDLDKHGHQNACGFLMLLPTTFPLFERLSLAMKSAIVCCSLSDVMLSFLQESAESGRSMLMLGFHEMESCRSRYLGLLSVCCWRFDRCTHPGQQ